jgi:hypothetical protein
MNAQKRMDRRRTKHWVAIPYSRGGVLTRETEATEQLKARDTEGWEAESAKVRQQIDLTHAKDAIY